MIRKGTVEILPIRHYKTVLTKWGSMHRGKQIYSFFFMIMQWIDEKMAFLIIVSSIFNWFKINFICLLNRNNVQEISLPKIGCGLDKLDWERVQGILRNVFKATNIKLTVYILDESLKSSPSATSRPSTLLNTDFQSSSKVKAKGLKR